MRAAQKCVNLSTRLAVLCCGLNDVQYFFAAYRYVAKRVLKLTHFDATAQFSSSVDTVHIVTRPYNHHAAKNKWKSSKESWQSAKEHF